VAARAQSKRYHRLLWYSGSMV